MEKHIKLMLPLALFGILVLVFIASHISPRQIVISDITNASMNEEIQVIVQITSIREYNNDTFQVLTLKDSTGNISAIANSKTGLKDKINVSQRNNYSISGIVQDYNGSIQININEIRKI